MKILEIFEENRLEFRDKCMRTLIRWMIPIGELERSKLPEKFFAIGPKMKLNFVSFKKIFWTFDQNFYWKLTFFTIFSLIFLGVLPPLRKYIPLEDYISFFPIFSYLGGDPSGVPPPFPTLMPFPIWWDEMRSTIQAIGLKFIRVGNFTEYFHTFTLPS